MENVRDSLLVTNDICFTHFTWLWLVRYKQLSRNVSEINSLGERCLYSEFFWSVFSRIWTEYGEISSISPYWARMRENTDQ